MVLSPDAERAQEVLARLGTPLPPKASDPIYRSAVSRQYRVDGVEADLMAGMAIERDGTLHDCSLRREDIAGTVTVCGRHVPPALPRLLAAVLCPHGPGGEGETSIPPARTPLNGGAYARFQGTFPI